MSSKRTDILKINYEKNLQKQIAFSFIPAFERLMTKHILSLPKVTEIIGAREMITNLTQHPNYAIAFATGSLQLPALIKLEQANIPFEEDLVLASNQIFEREGIVSKAIEKAKSIYQVSSFEHIIAVGDGVWYLKAAQNLGLHFIGIGMKNWDDFRANKIQVHIKNWKGFDIRTAEKVLEID